MTNCIRTDAQPLLAPSPRTRVRRAPKRAVYEQDAIHAILDEAPICHLGFTDAEGQPFVVPTIHARVGDELLLHGSAASRAFRTGASGAPVCVTVTIVDGMVLARSAFNHSMNYRSAVVLGSARVVAGEEAKLAALEAFTEKLVPGRWPHVRRPTRQELKGTMVLSLPLDEASAKMRTGGPVEAPEDYALDVWAGVVPLSLAAGEPIADTDGDAPPHVRSLVARHRGVGDGLRIEP